MIECSPPNKRFPRLNPRTFYDTVFQKNEKQLARGIPPGVFPAKGQSSSEEGDAAYRDLEYPESAGRLMDYGSEEQKIKNVKGVVLDRPDYVNEYKDETEEWRDNYVGHPPNSVPVGDKYFVSNFTLIVFGSNFCSQKK